MAAGSYEDSPFDAPSEMIALHNAIGDLLPTLPRGTCDNDGAFVTLSGDCWTEKTGTGAESAPIVEAKIEFFIAWDGIWRSRHGRAYPVVVGEAIGGSFTALGDGGVSSLSYFLHLPVHDFGLKMPHSVEAYANAPRSLGRGTADARLILQNTNFSPPKGQRLKPYAIQNAVARVFGLPLNLKSKDNNA